MTLALFADFKIDWSQYLDSWVDFFELLLSISFSVALAWPTLPSFAMIQFTWAFTGVAVQQGLSLFMDAYPVVLCAVVSAGVHTRTREMHACVWVGCVWMLTPCHTQSHTTSAF